MHYKRALQACTDLDVQPVEKDEEDVLTEHIADTLHGPDNDDEASHVESCKRMGRFMPNSKKPRPVLIMFSSPDDKHKLLKMSQKMRERGLRLDDWLTEVQQQERSSLNNDFQTLKGKGYKPFFRGSVLVYRSSKTHVFARRAKQTLPHLLHRASVVILGVILIAFTEPLLILIDKHCLLQGICT